MFRTPSAGRVSWDWARLAARTTRRLVLGATMLALAHCGGGSVPTSEVPSALPIEGLLLASPSRFAAPPRLALVTHAEEPEPGLSQFSLLAETEGYAISGFGPTSTVHGDLDRLGLIAVRGPADATLFVALGPDGMPSCAWDSEDNRAYFPDWRSGGTRGRESAWYWDGDDGPSVIVAPPSLVDLSVHTRMLGQTLPPSGGLGEGGASFTAGMQALAALDLVSPLFRSALSTRRADAPPWLPAFDALADFIGSFTLSLQVLDPDNPQTYFRYAPIATTAKLWSGTDGGRLDLWDFVRETTDPVGLRALCATLVAAFPVAGTVSCAVAVAIKLYEFGQTLLDWNHEFAEWLRKRYFDLQLPAFLHFATCSQSVDPCRAIVSQCGFTTFEKTLAEAESRALRYLETGLPYALDLGVGETTEYGSAWASGGVDPQGMPFNVGSLSKLPAAPDDSQTGVCGIGVSTGAASWILVREDIADLVRVSGNFSASVTVGPPGAAHEAENRYQPTWLHEIVEPSFSRSYRECGPQPYPGGLWSKIMLACSSRVARDCRASSGAPEATCRLTGSVTKDGTDPRIDGFVVVALFMPVSPLDPLYFQGPYYHADFHLARYRAHDPDNGVIGQSFNPGIVAAWPEFRALTGESVHPRYPTAVLPGQTLHLRVRFCVMDDEGREVCEPSRDLEPRIVRVVVPQP